MTARKAIGVCSVWFTFVGAAFGQGFINLNFEQAKIPRTPVGQYGAVSVDPALAFPGWTMGPSGTSHPNLTVYNNLTVGSVAQVLVGPNYPNGIGYTPLQGSYSALLQFGPSPSYGTPALIQIGMVPSDARSINFLVSARQNDARVTLDGVNIPLIVIGGGRVAGDVTAFAGRQAQLMFSTTSFYGSWLYFDDVMFSPTAVPEPSIGSLAILGLVCLFCERTRRSNKITGPNAGGPRQFPIRTPLAACVGQFYRSAASCVSYNRNQMKTKMTQNIIKALAATSLTLLVGCATQHQGAQNGREFSFSADFLTYPYEANTSSNVWQYFYRIDMANRTGVYERLPNYSRSIHNGGTEAWGVGNNDPPYIGKHMTADTLFSTRFQVGEMNVHPANDRLGIAIGFQAPEKGLYDLSGSVRPVSGGSINWYLDKGTASDNLKSGLHLRSGRSTFSIPRVRLSAGDFIYLIVDDDGDYTRDWTAVEFIARLTEQSH